MKLRRYKWTMCERANQLEESQQLGVDSWEDIYIYAKYLKTMCYSEDEAEELIANIVANSFDGWMSFHPDQTVQEVMEKYYNLNELPMLPIYFYKEELDVITHLDNFIQQKILFCLLYMRKYTGYVSPEVKHSDFTKLCGKRINASTVENALDSLEKAGYIKTGHYKGYQFGRYKFEIRIIKRELTQLYKSEPVIEIENEHNIINYYLQYIGKGTFIKCENCGKLVERTSNALKYCADCKKIMERERHRKYNQKRKIRKNDNSDN